MSSSLYPGELLSHIERSFRENLVDEFFVRPKDIEKALALGKEKTLAMLGQYRMYRLLTDTISELERWACFRAESHVRKGKGARKIGLNEPCPCGIGRKYKKCYGQFS